MKKRLLFMIINMNIGGTEKALLNMLAEMDSEKYEVTLLMLEEYGGFLEEVPSWVDIKYLNGYVDMKSLLNNPLHYSAIEYLKQSDLIKFFQLSIMYLATKITGHQTLLYKYLLKNEPLIQGNYDIAVAYAGPMDFISYYIINKINAKKKIQ